MTEQATVLDLVGVVLRNKRVLDEVRLAQARLLLARARAATPDIWSDDAPLVSVRIATYNRPELLVERALASVRRQTYQRFEIVVVGDGAGPKTAAALAALGDGRVRYHNLAARPRYARFPRAFWATAGTHAANAALERCRGAWIAPLDDDDEFTDDHLEVLLGAARAAHLEMVYGKMAAEDRRGAWREVGAEPLRHSHVCHGAVLYSARLLCLRYDLFAWLADEPGDWNLWKRMLAIGAHVGFVPQVVGRHYAEHSAVDDDEERRRLYARAPTPEEILADVMETGGEQFLRLV